MAYIVDEIQTNNGVTTIVPTAFDSEAEAESRYHDILHYAAVSTIDKHGAMYYTDDGRYIDSKCYEHK